jgi:hypothetical protein
MMEEINLNSNNNTPPTLIDKPTFDELCTNLNLISKIKPGEKLFVKNNIPTTFRSYDYVVWLKRMYYNENRLDGLTFVTDTVNNSIYFIQTYERMGSSHAKDKRNGNTTGNINGSSEFNIEQLKSNLEAAITGIEYLKATYSYDSGLVSGLDTCIQKINNHMGIVVETKKNKK